MRAPTPSWMQKFYAPAQYKTLYGGRSSAKTWGIAQLLVVQASQQPLKIHCARAIQKSLAVSAKPAIQIAIRRCGLEKEFDVGVEKITHLNGSEFRFLGLELTREEIRGWESVDRVWVEEAQRMSDETAQVLIPTVVRHPGAELLFSWNPINRTDWVWQRFVVKPRPTDIIQKVNYDLNPFLTKETMEEIEACRRDDPETYRHVWLGEPDDGAGDTRVLPYRMLLDCVEAWKMGLAPEEGVVDAGLDIADGGGDRNALVIRRGPTIVHVETWPSADPGFLAPTAARAHTRCAEYGVWRLAHDSGGVGSGIRGELSRLRPDYRIVGINFGQSVGGPKRMYEPRRTNKDVFAARNAQMAFALRLRAMRTVRLMRTGRGDPDTCLFIPADVLPRMEQFLAEMSRPLWRRGPTTGKIEIDKRGGEIESPDSYDAAALAFSRDSDQGIRADIS